MAFSLVSLLGGALPAAGQQANPPKGGEAGPRIESPYVGPEVAGAVVTRVSDSAAYESGSIVDTAYSAAFWYAINHELSLGARYEFVGLGSGKSHDDPDYVDADYSAQTAWIVGRVYPFEFGRYAAFLEGRAGIVWMRQEATGVRTVDFADPAGAPFKCSGTSAPNWGLGVGLGVLAAVGERGAFVAQGGASMLRGSDDVVDGCVPGLGSTVLVQATLGFAYYFGV